ncbi:hypothetical protein ARMSODRAFT_972138 [Armillaria solidipes]|uniref:Uncharacterized protein n=1 Tax=Armillaria solidipes TaxID=1076256 RepID=A0A2H3CEM4_9AGAR|nr:hypothetical protein ARMSODRAFT_972138 [Armillaria solidipes]
MSFPTSNPDHSWNEWIRNQPTPAPRGPSNVPRTSPPAYDPTEAKDYGSDPDPEDPEQIWVYQPRPRTLPAGPIHVALSPIPHLCPLPDSNSHSSDYGGNEPIAEREDDIPSLKKLPTGLYTARKTGYILRLCSKNLATVLKSAFSQISAPFFIGQSLAVPKFDGINRGYFPVKTGIGAHWDILWVLGGPGDSTSICLNINNIKTNPLVRYGGPGEGLKRFRRSTYEYSHFQASENFGVFTSEFPDLKNPQNTPGAHYKPSKFMCIQKTRAIQNVLKEI